MLGPWGGGRTASWAHLQAHERKRGLTPRDDRVKVDEHGGHALPAAGRQEPLRVRIALVGRIVVPVVALASAVARDVDLLHALEWQARQQADLLEQRDGRRQLGRELAAFARPSGASLQPGVGRLQPGKGGSDELCALLVGEEAIDPVHARRLANRREARVRLELQHMRARGRAMLAAWRAVSVVVVGTTRLTRRLGDMI